MKVFFYVQHLLGIGHLKRAATIARALRAAGFEVTLASGGLPVEGIEVLQLPPARSDDAFRVLLDETGKPVDEAWKARRRDLLLESFDHDALIVELFPFGRRQMRFELIPLLERARGRLVVSSVRDILQPKPAREDEALEYFERYFDRLLVHGDPRLVRLERSFGKAARLAGKLHYTGYVVDENEKSGEDGKDEVLVSAGGGAVGRRLLEAALAARPLTTLRDRTWRVLTGVDAAPGLQADGVIVERARQDFTLRLKNCVLSVSQAGYNTVLETLQARARAVLVPYAGGGESEQTLRARLLSERGLVHLVEEEALAPATLAAAIDRAASARGDDRPRRRAAQRRAPARVGEMSWREFEDECARRRPRFWWRDDDAAAVTPALQKLVQLSNRTDVPLALAVIPETAQAELFPLLRARVAVIQHGTDHRNRAAAGEKKTEYPQDEPMEQALARIAAGHARLRALAGPRLAPVLAPPWNRVRKDLLKKLPAIGIRGISTYGPRASAEPAPALRQVNTHVDIVAWREGKGFVGEAEALSKAIQAMKSDEPVGWLTHHAVHDAAAWAFLERLLTVPDIRWLSVEEAFSYTAAAPHG